jgi:hypothetical protein
MRCARRSSWWRRRGISADGMKRSSDRLILRLTLERSLSRSTWQPSPQRQCTPSPLRSPCGEGRGGGPHKDCPSGPPPPTPPRKGRCARSPLSPWRAAEFRFDCQTARTTSATQAVIARSAVRRVGKGATRRAHRGSAIAIAMVGTLTLCPPYARTRLRLLAARNARVMPLATSLENRRAQGRPWEGRVSATPMAPVRKKCTGAGTKGAGGTSPALPAQWFYGLYVVSPVRPGFVVTVVGVMRKHHRQVGTCIGAPGPHDFAVRESCRSSCSIHASTASRAQRP